MCWNQLLSFSAENCEEPVKQRQKRDDQFQKWPRQTLRRNRLCKERWKQESEACEFHRCQSRRATWWILCDANKSTTSATLIEDEAGAEANSNVKESSQVFLLFRSPTCRGTEVKGEGVVVKEISLVVPGTYPEFPASPIFQSEGAVRADSKDLQWF